VQQARIVLRVPALSSVTQWTARLLLHPGRREDLQSQYWVLHPTPVGQV